MCFLNASLPGNPGSIILDLSNVEPKLQPLGACGNGCGIIALSSVLIWHIARPHKMWVFLYTCTKDVE